MENGSCKHCGINITNNPQRNHRIHFNKLNNDQVQLFNTFQSPSEENGYFCRKCFSVLVSLNRLHCEFRSRMREDADVALTPISKKRKRETNHVSSQGQVKIPKRAQPAVRWLCRHQYLRAAKAIAKIPSAAQGLTATLATKIRQESRYFCQTSALRGSSYGSIDQVFQDLNSRCPSLCKILQSVTGAKENKPRIVAAAYILLNNRKKSINIFQKTVGLLLWKGQLRSLMFKRLKLFGLTTTRPTTLRLVDEMSARFDRKIKEWKSAIECQENMQVTSLSLGAIECVGDDEDTEWVDVDVQEMEEETSEEDAGTKGDDEGTKEEEEQGDGLHVHEEHTYCEKMDLTYEESIRPGDMESDVFGSRHKEHETELVREKEVPDQQTLQPTHLDHSYTMSPHNKELHPGYQLIFDNVNLHQKCRFKTSATQNKQFNMVQVYSVLDRINCEQLDNTTPILPDIRQLDKSVWWMTDQEQQQLKHELQVLIGRIAVKYIPCLKSRLEEVTESHISHKFLEESSRKSNVDKLGLIQKDEMKVQEVVDLMDDLQQYCPETVDGQLIKVPFGGDGLSVMKSLSAQKARADAWNAKDGLLGLIPKAEDWHESVIILQDTFKKHYKVGSVRDKGTLYNLRELFDRRGVRASAKDAVNDNREFIHFVTHGFVVLALMHVLGMTEMDESPGCVPALEDTFEVKRSFLHGITSSVVDGFVFPRGVLPSGDCSNSTDPDDSKFKYVCSVMREGLLDMARVDAVRENDGCRIILHWKYDFIHFFVFKHTNYKSISFRLLAQVFGMLTPRMAARIIFNRTVNVHGGIGSNISLDLFNEFLNRDVKEDLKRSGPNLTNKLLQRIGRSKQVMDEFLHSFDHDVEIFTGVGRRNKPDWSGEISQMVDELHPERLFDVEVGRSFNFFKDFKMNEVHSSLDSEALKAWVTVHTMYLHLQQDLFSKK